MKFQLTHARMRIRPLAVLASLVLIGATAGCAASTSTTPTPSSGKPINIGVILPLSGSLTAAGNEIASTAEYAAKQINAKGGVDGSKINIVRYDSQLTPSVAVQQFTKAVTNDHVAGVIGLVTSSEALAVKPLAERYKIPMLVVGANVDAITVPASQYVFRIASTVSNDAGANAAVVKEEKCTKPAGLYDDSALGVNFKQVLPKYLGSTKLVADPVFSSTATNLNAQLQIIRAAGANCIVLAGVADAALGSMVKQMAQTGYLVPVISGSETLNASFSQAAGEDAIGQMRIFATSITAATSDRITKAFKGFVKPGGPQPSSVAIASYDAVGVFAAALNTSKGAEGAALAKALNGTTSKNYDSLVGVDGSKSLGFSAKKHDWISPSSTFVVQVLPKGEVKATNIKAPTS